MVPSRWFRREGPFVGAHYALENGPDQLRRRGFLVPYPHEEANSLVL
jgi:hypothetical protein